MKDILSRPRTAMLEFVASHLREVELACVASRFAATVAAGTAGSGRPVVVGACAAISLTADYVMLRLTR